MEQLCGNSLLVKEINTQLVRKALKGLHKATKQQIANVTGLSIVTVGTVLQQLLKQNEVFEAELALSKGGRPAQQYTYNADYALGLILYTHEKRGTIYIHAVVVNLVGAHIAECDIEVANVNLARLEAVIDEYALLYPSIKAIGMGLPGTEYNGKMIVSDYTELLGVSIIEYFNKRYNVPVVVENDVNAAVVGLAKKNAKEDKLTIVYIFFPGKYTPGAGILIDGQLYRGKRNFAGEISNIPLGVDWTNPKLYTSFELVCDAIARLIIAITSVIDPDKVILHGNFLSLEHKREIAQRCFKTLPQSVAPELLLSETFADDFQSGMIVKTLGALETGLVLSRN